MHYFGKLPQYSNITFSGARSIEKKETVSINTENDKSGKNYILETESYIEDNHSAKSEKEPKCKWKEKIISGAEND